ncbi:replication initiator protein A [Sandaracinobacteroides saxicola]|uniref:Replication initiator protein A n=1 Tax=Sandaracinobacteroides saxicola TaxID=2759707 RepID=A0A7G5IGI6_9SPHN|nr:replication initiator protein A [Sandaracinobacteroides saxicola]QMW22478.1 replication initiator protein A [Sandaracinobacteroides saxicola]
MRPERAQLNLFRVIPRDMALRDAQDLMAYPFFSLAKSRRVRPIVFAAGDVSIRVEAVPEHGMATIWDADVLIWAASHIVEARDAGLKTSRLLSATPFEMLTFMRRGTSGAAYARLKAALDRLQSTTIATSIGRPAGRRLHRFSWINEWVERSDASGAALGIELILPDWFYQLVLDQKLILTIDPGYFALTGGLERWLYRIVRKHGGRQSEGWRFNLHYLHLKSGSLAPYKWFSGEVRAIVKRQSLPGYWLAIEPAPRGGAELSFRPNCAKTVDSIVRSVTRNLVRSLAAPSCDHLPKSPRNHSQPIASVTLNFESNVSSNFEVAHRRRSHP